MNIAKITNDIELLRNLGKTFESDFQKKAEADLHRAEGGVLAIKELITESERIYNDFANLSDEDLIKEYQDDELLNSLIKDMVTEPTNIETINCINTYVIRSIRKIVINRLRKLISSSDSKRTKADMRYLKAMGAISSIEDCVNKIKNTLDERVGRLEDIERALAKGSIVQESDGELMNNGEDSDIPGIHPGLPLKAQRLAEEAKEKENVPVVS